MKFMYLHNSLLLSKTKKRADVALCPTFLKIGTVVDIYLGCNKKERPHPRNPQNAFYRPDLHDIIT